MKPSHTTTPRQMRDGQWSYGSVSAEPPPWRASDLALAAILVGVMVLIFWGVI